MLKIHLTKETEIFDPILAAVDRTKLYRVYYLQHSVPRLNNPSGVFDNDQYLYSVYVDEDDTDAVSNLDALWGEIETECAAVGIITKLEGEILCLTFLFFL
jgi:hypothetical protein